MDSHGLEVAGGIAWMLYNIKFCLDSIIYYVSARTFRKALKDVCCCRISCCTPSSENPEEDCTEEVLENIPEAKKKPAKQVTTEL